MFFVITVLVPGMVTSTTNPSLEDKYCEVNSVESWLLNVVVPVVITVPEGDLIETTAPETALPLSSKSTVNKAVGVFKDRSSFKAIVS